VWKIYGSSKLYTPTTFGGDPNEAIEYFTKSIDLYEQQNDTISNWLYLDTHAFLGMAYEKVGKTKEAITTYEKALVIEPNYKWVASNLLPSAKKKL
jgi:tetratricopeptide (TPR) repeat protein